MMLATTRSGCIEYDIPPPFPQPTVEPDSASEEAYTTKTIERDLPRTLSEQTKYIITIRNQKILHFEKSNDGKHWHYSYLKEQNFNFKNYPKQQVAFFKFDDIFKIFPNLPQNFERSSFTYPAADVQPLPPNPSPKTNPAQQPAYTVKRLRVVTQMDYIPIVATIKAIAVIVLKLLSPILPENVKENRLYTQLTQENWLRSLLFITLPVISSLVVGLYDYCAASPSNAD